MIQDSTKFSKFGCYKRYYQNEILFTEHKDNSIDFPQKRFSIFLFIKTKS